ncbi:phosphomethylpyrimidine kinase [Pseudomonas sp. HPB0071]|uniref:hydroxymethylpyrimidine kinase n=2 Tax=Pseudomonas luteola TaxID=47886 RepID=A0A2X2C415_PSELU|nr:phosphomethylpyrimidine kinase [Pseudomonas sp. HPB0071]SHI57823.1 hydroxymethylpyrimidine/phosphomethylpyrimidine kinase [Pseudomonas zeshuii]SPZ02767.1 phosphomethylpyrimidine kinase [Pseudomonas luteola]
MRRIPSSIELGAALYHRPAQQLHCRPEPLFSLFSDKLFAMNTHNARPVVLCLSGHDPSGGAGLQADIEALIAQGCHAAPAVTALTVQDTINVSDFRVLDRAWVMAQANAVLTDLPVAAVKLGMLGSIEMVETVLDILADHPQLPLVCDPVLRAGGGGALGKDEVGYAIRERLLPRATIVTPNLPEARILAELPEGTADACADKLLPYCEHLLITGGHGDEQEVHNRLYTRDGHQETFICQRLPGSYHGSGCTLASALAGRLALGEALPSAVRSALDYTWRTLRDAERPGRGQYIPRRLPLDFCS